jgi:hypothetical protein
VKGSTRRAVQGIATDGNGRGKSVSPSSPGTEIERFLFNFICHKRASSGFFFQKNPPKPKKGPNLFFEVEIVSLA